MATSSSTRTLVALAFLLAACSSEDGKRTTDPEPDGGSSDSRDSGDGSEEDAGAAPAPGDDAATPGPSTDTVPLTVWVDDLIEHRTTDGSEPDTVEDKKIEDDTDETSFDKYLH